MVVGFTTDRSKKPCTVVCVLGPHMLDFFKAGYGEKEFFNEKDVSVTQISSVKKM